MALQIVPMTKQDIPEAVECVQTAFADDPYFHWLFDSSEVSFDYQAIYPLPKPMDREQEKKERKSLYRP